MNHRQLKSNFSFHFSTRKRLIQGKEIKNDVLKLRIRSEQQAVTVDQSYFRFLFHLARKSKQSGFSKSEKSLAKRNATLILIVKSNQWSIINAAFRLVELLLGYMLWPTSSQKRRLFGGKKGLKSSFNQPKLFCLDIFDRLVIPRARMGSESMAHSGPRNNC